MEPFTSLVTSFYNDGYYLLILGPALVTAARSARSFFLVKNEKNSEQIEKSLINLWLATSSILFLWTFYSRGFFQLDHEILNYSLVGTMSLMGIIFFISWYDNRHQAKLDQFLK